MEATIAALSDLPVPEATTENSANRIVLLELQRKQFFSNDCLDAADRLLEAVRNKGLHQNGKPLGRGSVEDTCLVTTWALNMGILSVKVYGPTMYTAEFSQSDRNYYEFIRSDDYQSVAEFLGGYLEKHYRSNEVEA